jgi:hypothetical protein
MLDFMQCALFLLCFKQSLKQFTNFSKLSNIKFYKNSFHSSEVITCGLTDRQRDMTKLMGVL